MSDARPWPRQRELWWSWLLGALLQVTAVPVQALEARVRAGLEVDGEAWIGQQVILKIDLLTNALSFSGQRIHLPDVPGALVLEDAVSTVKLSERVDGETWQVLSYRYPLFAQRAGRIEIAPAAVAFAVAEGYGKEAVPFDLETAALVLQVRSPPGVSEPERLVTTTNFALEVEITPDAADLQVGDALTRTVTRSAAAVSGMAFAPLPVPDIPGVAVYPKAPEVADSNNRGDLNGTRVDAVTYVLQQAGRFTIPEIELQWWNPVTATLHTETIAALTLEVAPNPDLARGTDPLQQTRELVSTQPWRVLAIIVGLAAALWAAFKHIPPGIRRLQRWRAARRESEGARFRRLLLACRSDDPARSYNAHLKWVSGVGGPAPAALREPTLVGELKRVQTALVQGERGWRGAALASALQGARRAGRRLRRESGARVLPALNPQRFVPLERASG